MFINSAFAFLIVIALILAGGRAIAQTTLRELFVLRHIYGLY